MERPAAEIADLIQTNFKGRVSSAGTVPEEQLIDCDYICAPLPVTWWTQTSGFWDTLLLDTSLWRRNRRFYPFKEFIEQPLQRSMESFSLDNRRVLYFFSSPWVCFSFHTLPRGVCVDLRSAIWIIHVCLVFRVAHKLRDSEAGAESAFELEKNPH